MSNINNNNNKRNIEEEEEEEENDNKKQKLNDEILKSLDNKFLAELKTIASIYGISVNSATRKNQLLDKIKAIINREQMLLEKKEIDSKINSFNKTIIEFKIKDGVDKSEWLFWKIFRNKYIYKKIMSFMDTRFSVLYESITSVTKMIKGNQIAILRDKVSRNQYLTFDKNKDSILDDEDDISTIFKTIKNDNQQDYSFYKSFFMNYNKYILNWNNTTVGSIGYEIYTNQGDKAKEVLYNQIIKFKCFVAIKVLVQEFNYQPNKNNLIFSINKGSIKLFEYTKSYQQQQQQQQPINILQLLLENLSLTCFSSKKHDYHLKSFKILNHCKNLQNMTRFQLLSYIKENIIDERVSTKILISICKLLISTSTSITTNIGSNIIEIETFTNNFTKQDIKLPLSDSLNQISPKKEIIKKLLDIYFSFGEFETKPEFYYLYFDKNDGGSNYGVNKGVCNFGPLKKVENIEFDRGSSNVYLLPFQFANTRLLEQSYDKYNMLSSFDHRLLQPLKNNKDIDLLFSHCNDKEKKYDFLNFVMDKIRTHEKYEIPIIDEYTLLCLLAYHDDLELLQRYTSQMSHVHFLNNDNPITLFIKSKKILEHLFENYKRNVSFEINHILWYFKNTKLLKHFETLHKSNSGGTGLSLIPMRFDMGSFPISNCSSQHVRHIVENGSSIYRFHEISDLYQLIEDCIPQSEKLGMFKLAFYNFHYQANPNNRNTCNKFFPGFKSYESFKFLDWLLNNHRDHLYELNEDDTFSKSNVSNIFYLTGRYDQLSCVIVYGVVPRFFHGYEELNLVKFLLNHLKTSNPVLCNYFKILIKNSAKLGRLRTLETIYQHSNWVFKYNSKSLNNNDSNVIFSLKELKSMLFISLEYSQLEVSEFFFGLNLSITKKEFIRCSSMISFAYFEDRMFLKKKLK